MSYFKKLYKIIDNYIIARIQHRASTASFWYLSEPSAIKNDDDLQRYQDAKVPFYLIDYKKKLNYLLENESGIIVLPYDKPIGHQINPEAAFQYALGLHDQYYLEKNEIYLKKFFKYADYFSNKQASDGTWSYDFDWYASKAPWGSALAQARGASVLLRAWLHTNDEKYSDGSKKAIEKFNTLTSEGGFLHHFSPADCYYFEEYPQTPTGVMNGFMACLMCIWELKYWFKEAWLENLWKMGVASLEKMLPYYSTGWWSLYDLDSRTPVLNVNSPRYHQLEIEYLQILSLLSDSRLLHDEYKRRLKQYNNPLFKCRALSQKLIRKIIYK